MQNSDPSKARAKDKSKALFARLGISDIELTEHESVIAAEVVHPNDISVKFEGLISLSLNGILP
jgi:hypothetical protein